MLPEAGTGVGVAQIQGCVCEPSRTGPPRTWLVSVRLAHGRPLPLPLESATKVFSPGAMPVNTPRSMRVSSSATKLVAHVDAVERERHLLHRHGLRHLDVDQRVAVAQQVGTVGQRADLEIERWELCLGRRHPRVRAIGHCRNSTSTPSCDRQQRDAERTDPCPMGQTHAVASILCLVDREIVSMQRPAAASGSNLTSEPASHNQAGSATKEPAASRHAR